jgi:hypothetical protein
MRLTVEAQTIVNEVHNNLMEHMMLRLKFISEFGEEAWDNLPENIAIREHRATCIAVERMTVNITKAAFACIRKWPNSVSPIALEWLINQAEAFHIYESDWE